MDLFNKTHASITAGLETMIRDLDSLTKKNNEKVSLKNQTIATLKIEVMGLEFENKRCTHTASALGKIIGLEDEIPE